MSNRFCRCSLIGHAWQYAYRNLDVCTRSCCRGWAQGERFVQRGWYPCTTASIVEGKDG